MKHQTDSYQVHSLIVHYYRKDSFYYFNSAKRLYLLSCSNIKVYFWNEGLFFSPFNWKGFQPHVKKSLQFWTFSLTLRISTYFLLKTFCIYYGWMVDNFNFCALLVFSKFSIKSLHSGLPRWFSSAKKKKIHLSMQETQVRSLIRWDTTCLGATKPLYRNSWACALRRGRHKYWAHVLQLLKPELPRACALQQENSPQWEKPTHHN